MTFPSEYVPGLLVILALLVQARVCEWRVARLVKEIEALKADVRELKAQRAAVLRLEQ